MYDLGDYDRALDDAINAIRLYQNDPDYDTLAATAAGRIGDPAAARRRLEPILVVKDSAILRVAVAKLALATGDTAAALLHAQRALQLDPANEAAQAVLRALASHP
jgi:tetratricopeptide (TPR) repeat protein